MFLEFILLLKHLLTSCRLKPCLTPTPPVCTSPTPPASMGFLKSLLDWRHFNRHTSIASNTCTHVLASTGFYVTSIFCQCHHFLKRFTTHISVTTNYLIIQRRLYRRPNIVTLIQGLCVCVSEIMTTACA